MFGLVTDSTATLTEEESKNSNINIVPLTILLNGVSYQEGIDITNEEFYERIDDSSDIPKTSQPAVGKFVDAYNRLKEQGITEVLSVHISSGISGTVNAAKAAAELVKDIKIHIIDSKTLSRPIGNFVMHAAKLRESGFGIEQVKAQMEEMADKVKVYCLVGDLEYLHKGGRVSGVAYFLGSLLNINPIVKVNDQGVICAHEKVRSFKKGLVRLAEYVEKEVKETAAKPLVNIMYSTSMEDANTLYDEIRKLLPEVSIELKSLTPVIGSHTGSGSIGLGIVFYPQGNN